MLYLLKFVCLLFVTSYVVCSKYDKKFADENIDKMERPFRINKVNLLWQKARKHLGPKKLEELYVDLKLHDAEEGKLKALKAEKNGDLDGEKEASVRKAFLGIMEKFHLHDAMDLLQDLEKHKKENEASYIDRRALKRHETEFGISMDKKLTKLWEKANMADFTDDELYILKREFLHHQEKIEEFNQLKSEVEVMEGISDNSIDQFKYSNRSWKEIKASKEELKKKHKDLKRSYEDLSFKARPDEIGKLAFSEPRVYDLYASAKKANMTAEELDSFKEELQHFEHKIKKHEYMKEQARMEPGQHDKKEKYSGDINENSEWGKKAVDYGRKIKKIHTELKIRVEKAAGRHSEL